MAIRIRARITLRPLRYAFRGGRALKAHARAVRAR